MKKIKAKILAHLLYWKDSLTLWLNDKKIELLLNRNINAPVTEDEKSIIDHLIKHCRPVRRITRKGKDKYVLPLLTEITFGQYLDAREQANKGNVKEMVECYSSIRIEKIGDLIVASSWIISQLRLAESVEMDKLGGSSGDGEADEDTAILNMLHVVAETYRIPTLEAREIRYEDALKALIKNKKEYDRQVEIMRKHSRASY